MRGELTDDKLHDQTHQKYKLNDENKNLKHLLKNAEIQLQMLCESHQQHKDQKRKSTFILEKCRGRSADFIQKFSKKYDLLIR